MAKVGVIGDTHEPAGHPGYLSFVQDMFEAWDVDTVVHIGDVIDHHAISFHAFNPELPGPTDEFELALEGVQKWYKAFPKAVVCVGNHDERIVRLAASVNIPAKFVRNYDEVWETPGWLWRPEHVIDNVRYLHGTGMRGHRPAYTLAQRSGISTVCGHVHHASAVSWLFGPNTRLFGLDTGCGVDDQHGAFDYGKNSVNKSALSCGVVIDGHPYLEVMRCARGEPYHRSRF
jgi:predicted phosphodiesterase